MLSETIERAISLPMIDPAADPASAQHWRRRADAVQTAWRPPRGATPGDDTIQRVAAVCEATIAALTRRPPARPGHGVAHTLRVLALADEVIAADGLDAGDAARLRLAAATHDLGRVLLHDDGPALRHAEVSGVLLTDMRAALDFPDPIFLPARYAVLAHSDIDPHWDETSFRVVEDLRGVDRLDALGQAGLLRSLLFYGVDPATSVALLDGGALQKGGVLWGWWRMHATLYPLRIESLFARILAARAWGQALVAAIAPVGDPESLEVLATDLAAWVEPQDLRAGEDVARRLVALPRPERAAWAALLEAVRAARTHAVSDSDAPA